MPKSTRRPDFKFHVDPSCLTDSTDLEMSAERVPSSQTIVHHDSWPETTGGKTPETAEHIDDAPNPVEGACDDEQNARERQLDRIEAQIQAAARAVVASFEDNSYNGEDSVLSARTDDSYNQEHSLLAYEEGSALSTQTYETYDHENPHLDYDPESSQLTYARSEDAYETEDEDEHPGQDGDEAGDSSSHHDGDIEDDVFSPSENSGRSSINSLHDTSDEANNKELHSPVVGEDATGSISRIPSAASYTPMQTPHTPSKCISRPTFRNPSSVRAMQMSSPPASIFSSPRSAKRHLPAGSRMGTPSSHTSFSPSKRTPTRFKTKKEQPLILLHVTVLPLTWPHSRAISSSNVPSSLQGVKENYRLLHEKLGDTVLERGVLLPHPQDSYEVLEERLLEALELPVRPRARILKCGHYMGPDTPTSDEEGRVQPFLGRDRKWCDICEKDVKIEGSGMDGVKETKFRVKVYASNGLMRAGAWAAAWREMERVDVELEPYVESHLAGELEDFAAAMAHVPEVAHEHDEDAFEDEDENEPIEHTHHNTETDMDSDERGIQEEMLRRQMMEEERLREVYGEGHPRAESRMSSTHHPSPQAPTSRVQHGDSLPELLLAAFKVVMRDRKNIAICVLSVLVLLLALKPGTDTGPTARLEPVIRGSGIDVADIMADPVQAITTLSAELAPKPTHVEEPLKAPPIVVEISNQEPASIQEVQKAIPVEPEVDPAIMETPSVKLAVESETDKESDSPVLMETHSEKIAVESETGMSSDFPILVETSSDKPAVEMEPLVESPLMDSQIEDPSPDSDPDYE